MSVHRSHPTHTVQHRLPPPVPHLVTQWVWDESPELTVYVPSWLVMYACPGTTLGTADLKFREDIERRARQRRWRDVGGSLETNFRFLFTLCRHFVCFTRFLCSGSAGRPPVPFSSLLKYFVSFQVPQPQGSLPKPPQRNILFIKKYIVSVLPPGI